MKRLEYDLCLSSWLTPLGTNAFPTKTPRCLLKHLSIMSPQTPFLCIPIYYDVTYTGNGKVPAQPAISFFNSAISGMFPPPATLALKSFCLFASLGSSDWIFWDSLMH